LFISYVPFNKNLEALPKFKFISYSPFSEETGSGYMLESSDDKMNLSPLTLCFALLREPVCSCQCVLSQLSSSEAHH